MKIALSERRVKPTHSGVARELQTFDNDAWHSMYLNSIAIVKSCFWNAQLASVLTDNQLKQFNSVHGSIEEQISDL